MREAEKAKNIGLEVDDDRNNDEIRQERKLFFKNAPFTARSHVSYWRQRFVVSLACGVSSFIARLLLLKYKSIKLEEAIENMYVLDSC